MSDIVVPRNIPPRKNRDLTIPNEMAKGQASMVLRSFGLQLLKPKFYTIDQARAEREAATDDFTRTGLMGLPIFDTLVFERHSYELEDGSKVSTAEIVLTQVLIEVTQPKNVVITKIQGRDKAVKEYINGGDIMINIKGNLTGLDANQRPVELIKQMKALKNAPVELPIASNLLNDLDVYSIVILDVKIFEIEGSRNTVGFEIEAIDEVPFELKNAETTV